MIPQRSEPVPAGRHRPAATCRPAAVLALLLCVLLLPLVAATAPPAAALEQVDTADPLGDFEASGTAPQGWTVRAEAPNVVAATGSRAISGVRSLLVRDSSSTLSATATRAKFGVVPGREYFAQAYVFSSTGTQVMYLDFYDTAGNRVARQNVRSPAAHLVWSRVVVRAVAPPDAKTATVVIASSTADTSEAWWDAISAITPYLPNSSFEDAGTPAAPALGWYTAVGTGTSITQATAYSKTGRRSILVKDASTVGSTVLQTPRVPVFPGVDHTIRFWMRPMTGTFTLSAKWFTASGAYISGQSQSLSYAPGDWRLVSRTVTAPPSAARGIFQITTRSTTLSEAAFDTASFLPHAGAVIPSYLTESMGTPLTFDNTTAVEATVIDGRPKLYTIVSGYPAAFQVLDIQTNRVETNIAFPDPNISQTPAMTTGADGRVYLGAQGGTLWRWTPGATTLEPLGPATSVADAVWDLETGPDGTIWGGTSPDGVLFAFDPVQDVFRERVRVSADHTYIRSVAVDSSHVYVGASPTSPTVFRFPLHDLTARQEIVPPVRLQSGQLSELESHDNLLSLVVPGGTTADGQPFAGSRFLYDKRTGSFDMEANVPGQRPSNSDAAKAFYYIASGQLYRVQGDTGVRAAATATSMLAGRDRLVIKATFDGRDGEWLLAFDPLEGLAIIELTTFLRLDYPVTFAPTASRMKSMAPGPDGKLYIGGYGGASLSVVDPSTGQKVQYPTTRTAKNVIGEVEGMIANDRYMFLGTYTNGKIFRYDTTQPWVDGSNPALVADVSGQGQDRPQAWATAGPRTFFGMVPRYGVLGGHLGVIDTPTAAPRIIPQPVKDQSIVSAVASGDVVYGGTSRWGGLGIAPTQPTAKVFAFDVATDRKLWEVAPAPGVQSYGAVLITPEGALWAAAGPVLYELDRANGKVLRRVMISNRLQPDQTTWRNVDLEYLGGLLYLNAGGEVYSVDTRTLRVAKPAATTTTHPLLATVGQQLFYPDGTVLRRVTIG